MAIEQYDEYDGIDVKQSPDETWRVRHCYLNYWITGLSKEMAEEISKAFEMIHDSAHDAAYY